MGLQTFLYQGYKNKLGLEVGTCLSKEVISREDKGREPDTYDRIFFYFCASVIIAEREIGTLAAAFTK